MKVPIFRFLGLSHLSLLLFAISILSPIQAEAMKSDFVEKMADVSLFSDLRNGGYVLYMRHGTTDNSRADQTHIVDFNDCRAQRILNDEGRRLASRLGNLIRKAEIPIAEVFYGPMCRTRETAELVFPDKHTPMHISNSLASSTNLTSAEKAKMLQEMKKLMLIPIPEHSNRLLISHAPNLADFMKYFVKPEGTIVVLKVRDEQVEYVASIPPKLLEQLVK